MIEITNYWSRINILFFVLRRIMGGEFKVLLSDHERLIICFTGLPYPVWFWTPDDVTEAEMERAYRLAGENGLLLMPHGWLSEAREELEKKCLK